MRISVLIIAILIFFSVFCVFGQNVPFTWTTFNMLTQLRDSGESVGDLRFYLSKPLSIFIIDEHNTAPEITIRDGGIVNVQQGISSSSVLIDDSIEGRLISFPASGAEIIEIMFYAEEKFVTLRFRRNEQLDSFIVFSATINTRVYTLHSQAELPQLLIRSNIERAVSEVYAFVFSMGANQQPPPPPGNGNTVNQTGNRSRLLLGPGSLNVNDIITYIRTQNPVIDQNTIRLIELYISEALIENINYDIAIAQMLYSTNFLRNQQRVLTHNYAGFSQTSEWNGIFSNMNEGVRAHIQHLKGYSSREPLKTALVAPRYNLIASSGYMGLIRDFDDLYSAWTLNSVSYKEGIENILNGLYR
ncbi:MAG: glucosaminidase domain-containing protein [Treponema sp.]|nr:glucosaminidase domain-containing protein [Treponema sp.]